jgi:hypothetical protein
MTDRELLEWAAKAAGIDLWPEDVFTNGLTRKVSPNGIRCWNPLTDDGDALRLAVKLSMQIDFADEVIRIDCDQMGLVFEPVNWDKNTATRRAIVRAAADIVQGLETQSEKNARFRKALDEMPIAEPPHPPVTLGNTKPQGR